VAACAGVLPTKTAAQAAAMLVVRMRREVRVVFIGTRMRRGG